ncbi:hypothetical protein DEEACLCL_00068 [Salmonella phage CRW-SP2]|nr:hypothetical protein DEEACLCL_00068 [Salmonella phage CRW-SP2]
MSKIIVIKGTSATGKGTRVVQFIEWLRTKFEPDEVPYTVGGKTRPFGLKFEELKLLFVGQYTVSNKSGLASWTSMDAIHAATGSGEVAREFVKSWLEQGYTLVCEGEPLMQSDKWRPLWMFENYPIDALSILYFTYPDRYQYDMRIVGRSGKKAGDSAWARNVTYLREFQKTQEELVALGWRVKLDNHSGQDVFYESDEGFQSEVAVLPYDAPLWTIGNAIYFQLLSEFNAAGCDFKDFYSYCETNPMTREIGGADPLAHRVPEKAPKKSDSKIKASAPEVKKPTSVSILGLMKRG